MYNLATKLPCRFPLSARRISTAHNTIVATSPSAANTAVAVRISRSPALHTVGAAVLNRRPALLTPAVFRSSLFSSSAVAASSTATSPATMASSTGNAPEQVSSNKQFGGYNKRFKFTSTSLGCSTNFTVYFPPSTGQKPPVLFWLSGLTCTDQNFIEKSGAQRRASELGIALVTMDTSPRGLNVEGEADNWDFGVGAGFYLNATVEKFRNWRMYDYVVKELPGLLKEHFGDQLDTSRVSISGHSMGGHGALTLGIKNPQQYKSMSAFAPICHPSAVPWGIKAFTGYLGDDKETWKQYDAVHLLEQYDTSVPLPPILVDVGTADPNLSNQLKPDDLEAAASKKGVQLNSRLQDGYDHSYYFISSFIAEHLDFHAKALGLTMQCTSRLPVPAML